MSVNDSNFDTDSINKVRQTMDKVNNSTDFNSNFKICFNLLKDLESKNSKNYFLKVVNSAIGTLKESERAYIVAFIALNYIVEQSVKTHSDVLTVLRELVIEANNTNDSFNLGIAGLETMANLNEKPEVKKEVLDRINSLKKFPDDVRSLKMSLEDYRDRRIFDENDSEINTITANKAIETIEKVKNSTDFNSNFKICFNVLKDLESQNNKNYFLKVVNSAIGKLKESEGSYKVTLYLLKNIASKAINGHRDSLASLIEMIDLANNPIDATNIGIDGLETMANLSEKPEEKKEVLNKIANYKKTIAGGVSADSVKILKDILDNYFRSFTFCEQTLN